MYCLPCRMQAGSGTTPRTEFPFLPKPSFKSASNCGTKRIVASQASSWCGQA
jgi:hypothetical protein